MDHCKIMGRKFNFGNGTLLSLQNIGQFMDTRKSVDIQSSSLIRMNKVQIRLQGTTKNGNYVDMKGSNIPATDFTNLGFKIPIQKYRKWSTLTLSGEQNDLPKIKGWVNIYRKQPFICQVDFKP